MNMKKILCDELNVIFDIDTEKSDIKNIYNHFMNNRDEILYFCKERVLIAVVSIGDLFRYLQKDRDILLNYTFSKITEGEENTALSFFANHPTVHELPLVNNDGIMIGIIKSEQTNSEYTWNSYRAFAKNLYYDVDGFEKDNISKFLDNFRGKVFTLMLPQDSELKKVLKTSDENAEFENKKQLSPLFQLQNASEDFQKLYWGECYYPEIGKDFAKDFTKIERKSVNGVTYYKSSSNSIIKFDRFRITPNSTDDNKRIIFIGPCMMLGAYVLDCQTIEYYLQDLIIKNNKGYRVENKSGFGWVDEFQYLLTEEISDNDIVIVAVENQGINEFMLRYNNVKYLGDYSSILNDVENPLGCILDSPRHSNYIIAKLMAEKIYNNIAPFLEYNSTYNKNNPIQDYYIPWEVELYYKKHVNKYNLNNLHGKVGSIVMNCNPFTKGHRYLVEHAASKVDILLLFVVEEDRSFFSFKDRYEMVKIGVNDIQNVIVIPSGDYNISQKTFSQYFEKDQAITEISSMDFDIRIFCEVISSLIGIKYRFAGQEPTDVVTKKYNDTMKRILPEYGMEFIEIPRVCTSDGGQVISATKVREHYKRKEFDELKEYVPENVLEYLYEI